ncbi:MAG TPA: cytosine permease [Acidimicrobiales bacterium]|nr:cytosine permease [Acidimicrobiales bacterium]
MAVEPRDQPDRDEVPLTLVGAPPPRLLGLWDQTALWGNLGISLLLLVAAGFVLAPDPTLPPLSLTAALVAVVVGAVVGNMLLGLGAVPGAQTGAPAMVLLRGMFGRRGSWVPTAFNIVQNIGWATLEIWIIADAASRLTDGSLRWVFTVAAGAIATFMAVRPLGVVRGYLKRIAVWAVLASTAYLFVRVLGRDLPAFGDGSWRAFWKGADIVIALPVSWIPLAADYSRHSRSARAAFGGAFAGYGAATVAFFSLGVLAYSSFSLDTSAGTPVDVLGSLLALPAGALALLILAVDELDEAFANLYSTTASAQNVAPRIDRRWVTVPVGILCTVLALVVDMLAYENFLLLIGSVFVPLFAAFAVDYYILHRGRWDVSEDARPRWRMAVPWAGGFVAYQLVNPGTVGWWADWWRDLGFRAPDWASASLVSFGVAALLALVVGRLGSDR